MIYQAMIYMVQERASAKMPGLHSYFPQASGGVRASAEVTILYMKARDIITVKR